MKHEQKIQSRIDIKKDDCSVYKISKLTQSFLFFLKFQFLISEVPSISAVHLVCIFFAQVVA